ncbi:50S ribosomal protein L14 [archaeon]|nr:50S ribosomal protein L14 [archaeon]|tara:strand:- start:677 stop:1078 length:402 start_codon:yes stop_codon:yes gene_type:complete
MKAIEARITKSLPFGARLNVCDNSGSKIIRIFSVYKHKTVKGRYQAAGVGDMVNCSIIKGKPGTKKETVQAIIVRQKKEFRRKTGERVKFEDNSAVVLKDDKGNPKGTIIKGPIAKEVAAKWPAVAKIASAIL